MKSNNFTLDLEYIGEGYDGDYDASNPEDRQLLRVTVYHKSDPDEPIRNGSFCTPLEVGDKYADYHGWELLEICERYLAIHGVDDLGGLGNQLGYYDFTLPQSVQFIKE